MARAGRRSTLLAMTTLHSPTLSSALGLADGEGETLSARGNILVIKAATPRVSVIDYTAAAGFPGPPLHIHPGFDEVFVVLQGSMTIRVRNEVNRLGPLASASVSGSVPHTFANETAAPVRFLVVCAPGGFEGYFRALVSGDQATIDAVSERFGYRPVPSG